MVASLTAPGAAAFLREASWVAAAMPRRLHRASCLRQLLQSRKTFGHVAHAKGFAPVCVRAWRRRLLAHAKVLAQTVQEW